MKSLPLLNRLGKKTLLISFLVLVSSQMLHATCNANFYHYSLSSNSDSVHFYPASQHGQSYHWTFGDGTSSTVSDPWHLYANPGTYYVCLILTDSTGATCDHCDSVHVGNPPHICNANFNHYALSGNPDSVHFYPQSTHPMHVQWNFGDGHSSADIDPWHYYSQPGTYYVCLIITDSLGVTCDHCDSVHVTGTSQTCNAGFNHYSLSSNPDSVHFYPVSTSATSYQWNFGDGSTSTDIAPWHEYAHAGDYRVCLILTMNGITCDHCDSVHVGNPPHTCNANFYHYSLSSNSDSVHFYPASQHGQSYHWTFGDGTSSTVSDPWHLYANPGTYYVCLILTDSTGATCDHCDSVHVGNPPHICNANFNHYVLSGNPDSVHFYPQSTHPMHVQWNFGDGHSSTDIDPWHYYSQPGTYYVCLIITDSLGVTCDHCDSVHVTGTSHTCNAGFNHYSLSSNPDSVHFYPVSTSATSYQWNFGDGSTSTDIAPWHEYAHAGDYRVCLILTMNGITCDHCDSVHVGNPPHTCNANFYHYSISSNPDSVHFYPASMHGQSYHWNFGDGSTSTNNDPWHLYANAGTYYVCLIITDSTGATCDHCDSVHVTGPSHICNAGFSHYALSSNPDSVHFYPVTTNATSYHWNFGDGGTSTDGDPWHVYAPGDYRVCLIITDATGATCDHCDSIHVSGTTHICNAHFNHYSLPNDSVHFYPLSTNIVSAHWTFGDGLTANGWDPWHQYAHNGTYTVCLIVTDSSGITCDHCESLVVTAYTGGSSSAMLNPNLIDRSTTVTIANVTTPVELRLYDFNGRLVMTRSDLTNGAWIFDTEALNQGIYYYTFDDGSNRLSQGKMIVVH